MPGYQITQEKSGDFTVEWSALGGGGFVNRPTRQEAMQAAMREANACQDADHAAWRAKDDRKTFFIYAVIVTVTTTVVSGVVWGIYWLLS